MCLHFENGHSFHGLNLCDMVFYPAGSNHYELVNCGHNRMHMVYNNTETVPFKP